MPVPENLPAPSARHKEMYKQYSEEMKQAYRTHSQPGKFNEVKDKLYLQLYLWPKTFKVNSILLYVYMDSHCQTH